ncbi:MAG: cytochrome b5 domain-containing protein [Lachnotalea sp.]
MKKTKLIIACTILSISTLFVACSTKTNDTTSDTSTTSDSTATNSADSSTTTDTSTTSQIFTLDELAQYNDQDGNAAYVAVDGIVYDVTNAKNWKNGTHESVVAGEDLTSSLASSPHGDSVLADLPVVGTLE